jgi:hypothetical protein
MQLIFEIGLSGPRLKFPFSLGFSLGNFFAGADLSSFRAFIGISLPCFDVDRW